MFELVSVHIPKCGGISVARALQRRYGLRLRLDYPLPESPSNLRIIGNVRFFLRSLLPASAVHGHFAASKYQGRERVVFVRKPLEIRISRYHYIHRTYARSGAIYNDDWRIALGMNLPQYIKLTLPDLSQFLDLPREHFSFVGCMERFEQDMRRFSEWLGIEYIPAKLNSNPDGCYEIPDEWRRHFEAANPSEIELYKQFADE